MAEASWTFGFSGASLYWRPTCLLSGVAGRRERASLSEIDRSCWQAGQDARRGHLDDSSTSQRIRPGSESTVVQVSTLSVENMLHPGWPFVDRGVQLPSCSSAAACLISGSTVPIDTKLARAETSRLAISDWVVSGLVWKKKKGLSDQRSCTNGVLTKSTLALFVQAPELLAVLSNHHPETLMSKRLNKRQQRLHQEEQELAKPAPVAAENEGDAEEEEEVADVPTPSRAAVNVFAAVSSPQIASASK